MLKFDNISEDWEKSSGTCLRGYITSTYDQLVEVFGEPAKYGEGDKVTAEWIIEVFDEETEKYSVATIYDWKQYELGTPYDQYEWHIGGHHHDAVDYVKELVGA